MSVEDEEIKKHLDKMREALENDDEQAAKRHAQKIFSKYR